MNIAVCDDDRFSREIIRKNLEMFIAAYPQYELEVFIFDHADDLISAAEKNGGFDIYILDVLMPDTDGIELGVMIRRCGYDGKIIYLSSSEEYVFDSFKSEPFNYIIKPVDKNRLFPILDKALSTIDEHYVKSIIVRTSTRTVKIPVDSIVYAELSEHAVVYHLKDSRTIRSRNIRISFSEAVRELLEDRRFFMCGISTAVNLDHIIEIDDSKAIFSSGESQFFSKKAMAELKNAWYDYCTDDK